VTRPELLNWLESALIARGIAVRRYMVEAGLEDIEISAEGVTHRLRTVRTGQH